MNQAESNKKDKKPKEEQIGPPNEPLAQRSVRLEAEAAAGEFEPVDPLEDFEGSLGQDDHAQASIIALQNEMEIVKDQMMRAMAEADNTRKRAIKEREDASKFAIAGFSKELLSVADNLRRALESVPADLPSSDIRVRNLLDGIEATERELLRSFEKNGIEKFEPAGAVFDPNFHEVMFEIPGTGKPPGTIVQVVETGYTLNGRLLRPARVGIAKDEGQGGSGKAPPAGPGGTIDTEA